ncbi:hypothetical protein Lpar_1052 [Legionella parisiensis]|uniref:Uncharacterized protein n=1 Tax=Legionella parisiensis TaxID=45071 RepID=A0A1E5JKW5_9GAMM|nr:hypothetical protein Lpar_1052 [Legionella parisiensis]OEH45154.1 hypothetical protein lpari_03924 [Legionella parisiensis]STX77846.1 Uncharacterised protein [Legionella parisiensis]
MSANTCHYCLEIKDHFSIRGQYRAPNGKFLCYRLCQLCSDKLIRINTYSDKQSRHVFLNTVKDNAKKNPLYTDGVV